jgi:hypothetical protein
LSRVARKQVILGMVGFVPSLFLAEI